MYALGASCEAQEDHSSLPSTLPKLQDGNLDLSNSIGFNKSFGTDSPVTPTRRPSSPSHSSPQVLDSIFDRIEEQTAKDKQLEALQKNEINQVNGLPLFHRDQFEELYKLGSGGLCDVWAVRHSNGRVFASSALRPFMDDNDNLLLLKNEAMIAQRLQGIPHVVSIEGIVKDNDHSDALLWRPVADGDLDKYFRECTAGSYLGLQWHALRLHMRTFFGCLAIAVARIHKRSIQHKDIKPANILFMRSQLYITDFNISKDTQGQPVTSTDGPIKWQTYQYAAPEVGRQGPRGSPADICSLAFVYLEIITLMCAASLPALRGISKPYWQKIPQLLTWLENLELPEFFTAEDKDIFPEVKKLVASMLNEDPAKRPKAAELIFPKSWCCTCCQQDLSEEEDSSKPLLDISCGKAAATVDTPGSDHSNSLPGLQLSDLRVEVSRSTNRQNSYAPSELSSDESEYVVIPATPSRRTSESDTPLSSLLQSPSDSNADMFQPLMYKISTARNTKKAGASAIIERRLSIDTPWLALGNINFHKYSINLHQNLQEYSPTDELALDRAFDKLTEELQKEVERKREENSSMEVEEDLA